MHCLNVTVTSNMGFSGGLTGKESACNEGDLSSIPGLGRSPGEGKDYPLHYSGLENSIECIVHGLAKSWTWLCIGDWNAKVGSQETPGETGQFDFRVQSEAGQRLIEFGQENALVIANTLFQQHKRRLYTWTSPDGWHQNQIDHILFSRRWRSSVQSAKTRPGADCGSDHELLIDKFRL